MKFATISKGLILGVALLLASSAFAANKANFTLSNPTTVNGTQLKAGDYKLVWDGTGSEVQVSFIQGKNVVAKVPGKLVDLNNNSLNDAAVVNTNGDGTTTLTALRFAGKKYSLELGASSDGMQAGSSK
ncbi:MAG: hypothetical protein WA477_24120 [Candidatus Sulfotelmatobacter sp.]